MEKIKKIIKFLIRENIDGYLVPKNDEFFGEYIAEENDRLKYVSNFTGSSGFSLITKNKNYLFVDGRYSLQAHNQSKKFFKIVTFPKNMPKDIVKNKKLLIGFDPKINTTKTLNIFFHQNHFDLKPIKKNLVDEIWKRKIEKTLHNFYYLPNSTVGQNYKSKINKIVSYIKSKGADYQLITASENNAWLLNIRGRDEKYSPIPHCYVLISKNKKIKFFCDLKKISPSFKRYLSKVNFVKIDKLEEILSKINKKKFIIDKNTCSFFFEKTILKNNKILNTEDIIYYLKAIKTRKELENIKLAHIHDGVALTKYLFWLKKNFNKKRITEISGSEKLYQCRKKNRKFKSLSFPTISGTGPNGAIIHYKAAKKTNRVLKQGDIYLVDSGGQYEFGTTDVTRTISLKNSNKRIKKIFTRVLKGHIGVSNFNLKEKTTGSKIDVQARKYLRKIGLDYAHGTGHGVGYFLNVHEGPHAISKNNKVILSEGMVLSNEPGYYEKNRFGMRIENLIYVKKEKKNKFFENLTMVPIDKELIDETLLNSNEKKWLNSYHRKVFKYLEKSMNKRELIELEKACSAI